MSESKPIGGKIFTGAFAVAFLFALIGGWFLIQRFVHGLGAVTNMSDGYPWGIWITYDVVIGTALGCGGFAMAILVYILNKGQYHPLVRSAIMTSVFGYTLAAFSVFIDIGRYWNMHHVLLPPYWNLDSVLLEVALCIALYVAVLWIEFSPAFMEKGGGPQASRGINKIMFIFIGLGMLLPLMHQSSLGTLMVISGYKLSPLWQTPLLPLLFLVTAITMGYSITIFESFLSSLVLKRPLEMPMVGRLSGLIPGLLIVYLVVRWGDLIARGGHQRGLRRRVADGDVLDREHPLHPSGSDAPAESQSGKGRHCLFRGLLHAPGRCGLPVQHLPGRLQPRSGVELLPGRPRDPYHPRDRSG